MTSNILKCQELPVEFVTSMKNKCIKISTTLKQIVIIFQFFITRSGPFSKLESHQNTASQATFISVSICVGHASGLIFGRDLGYNRVQSSLVCPAVKCSISRTGSWLSNWGSHSLHGESKWGWYVSRYTLNCAPQIVDNTLPRNSRQVSS